MERVSRTVAIFAIGSFIARLPFCLAGPGFDADSHLFLNKALISVLNDDYLPSRGPGYIIPDHIGHLFAVHGWVYLTLLCSFLHAISVPIFAKILEYGNQSNRFWALALYAFLPMHLIGYSDVMVDYPMMTLGVLSGWLYLMRGNLPISALLIGTAGAMRPSQGIFIVLIFAVFIFASLGWRSVLIWLALSGAMLQVFWIVPAILLEDYSLIFRYLPYTSDLRGYLRSIYSLFLSPLGIVPLSIIVLGFCINFRRVLETILRDRVLLLCIAVTIFTVLLFLRHPFKSNYLLIAIPFAIYAVGTIFSEKLMKNLVVFSLLHGLVAVPSSPPCAPRTILGAGTLIAEYRDRKGFLADTHQLLTQLPPKSVVLCSSRTIQMLSYDLIRLGLTDKYKVDIERWIIQERDRDIWLVDISWMRNNFEQEIILTISDMKKEYKVFSTSNQYAKHSDFLRKAGLLGSVSRLDTSRCL